MRVVSPGNETGLIWGTNITASLWHFFVWITNMAAVTLIHMGCVSASNIDPLNDNDWSDLRSLISKSQKRDSNRCPPPQPSLRTLTAHQRELVKCELDGYLVTGEIASSHVIITPLLLVRFFSQCRRRHIFKKMFPFFQIINAYTCTCR